MFGGWTKPFGYVLRWRKGLDYRKNWPKQQTLEWLAREVKKEEKAKTKNHKGSKREGLTPLSEIDPNTLEQKHRKVGKLTCQIEDEKTQKVGEEAVAVGQHHRAS